MPTEAEYAHGVALVLCTHNSYLISWISSSRKGHRSYESGLTGSMGTSAGLCGRRVGTQYFSVPCDMGRLWVEGKRRSPNDIVGHMSIILEPRWSMRFSAIVLNLMYVLCYHSVDFRSWISNWSMLPSWIGVVNELLNRLRSFIIHSYSRDVRSKAGQSIFEKF